jgi:hypothetical protein
LLASSLLAASGLSAPVASAGTVTRAAAERANGTVHPAHVEATIDHTAADYGSPLVISGAVIDPENPGKQPSDGEVELITRDHSGRHIRVVAGRRLKAADHGAFAFNLAAARTVYYIVKFLGGSGLSAADSAPLNFGVESLVTAEADRAAVPHGDTFTITADVLPAVAGEGAYVDQMPGNSLVALGRTDSHGHVSFRVPAPDKPGSYDYAVVCQVMNGDDQTEGVSKYLHITVT